MNLPGFDRNTPAPRNGRPTSPFYVIAVVVAALAGMCAVWSQEALAGTSSTWHVDCSAHQNGVGSQDKPFNNLDAANKLTLSPGDQLLFLKGATCTGMLSPRGGGTAAHPVVMGSYGSGNREAEIDGAGKVNAAVQLANMPYTTIENLELTNPGDKTHLHWGLLFTTDGPVVSGITVRNLLVQNVDSMDTFDHAKSSGGIVGEATGTGRFSDVLIEDNQVRDVSRQGITVKGTDASTRPTADHPWPQATSGLVIRGNTVKHVEGDGIVPTGTEGAIVEHNVVEDGNLSGYNYASPNRDCSVGIWTWDSDNTVIQDNEVSGMHYGPSTTTGSLNGCDGEGFDVDGDQDGTVIQDNLSYDNAGGFVLLCTSEGTAAKPNPPHHADVRYNLSIDDNATFNPSPCAGDYNAAVNNLDGLRLYNNTIVAPHPRVTLELSNSPLTWLGNFVFEDNVVVATSTQAGNTVFPCGTSCSHNLFFGMSVPSTATGSITGDPHFVNPSVRGMGPQTALAFQVKNGSPAIGAGVPVLAAGVLHAPKHDYFGAGISNPPTIGFSKK